MKLVIGLGNIGSQYTHTRHNLGFMTVDQLATQLEATTWKAEPKFKAALALARLQDQQIILAKPHTLMNLSGEAASRLLQFYKLSLADVWAVYDDLNVPFGRLRLRLGGSGGGHQGANSLIHHIGSEFIRARLGISLNDRTQIPSEAYVLQPFTPAEQTQLPTLIKQAADILLQQLTASTPTDTTYRLLPETDAQS